MGKSNLKQFYIRQQQNVHSRIAFGLVLYRVPCQCRALAWLFIVINRKLCLSTSRRHKSKVILFDRSSLSAEVKIN